MGPKSAAPNRMDRGNIGSWFAAAVGSTPDSRGIGVVFGYDTKDFPGQIDWGTYYGPTEDMQGTSLFVRRIVNVTPGETVYAKYFLVLGTVEEIRSAARVLEAKVELRKFKRNARDVGIQQICLSPENLPTTACPVSGAKVLMHTYSDYAEGAQPLFLIQNRLTGRYQVSKDPYSVSFDPSDGKSLYIDLLGWAMPEEKNQGTCLTLPLRELNLPHVEIDPSSAGLAVFTPDSDCP